MEETNERPLTDEEIRKQGMAFLKFFAVFVAVCTFVVVKFS